MRVQNHGEYILRFKDSPEVRELLFNKLLDFYNRHESYSGECIAQSDGPQIEAADLLGDIADDIFEFDVKYNE